MVSDVTGGIVRGRVALFGGSFDPVHRGHLEMARAVLRQFELDQFCFVPCYVSPFKSTTEASPQQRFQMLNIALAESGWSGASVSDFEINRPETSFTWETATHFRELSPETEWYWILGTDQWEVIDQWAKPELLRDLLHFIVMTRDGDHVQQRSGWRYTAMPFHHPASSTAIREDFEANRGWLTPHVAEFCQQSGLYQTSV